MESAIWGSIRWGHFRWGVTVTTFDTALEKLKNIPIPNSPVVSLEGSGCEGSEREAVYLPLFEDAKNRLSKV
jgi:hypothetical protein